MSDRLLHEILRHVAPDAEADGPLLDRFAARRDEAAFAALVHRHGGMVFAVARRVVRQREDAEDVFQATFHLLARDAGSLRRQTSVAGWLYRVAFRLSLRVRSQGVRRRRAEGESAPGKAADRSDLLSLIDEELHRLPDDLREPLLLCYLQAMTRDRAARQLGLSLRTLERRLSEGLELLRARLGRRGVELPAALLLAGLSEQAVPASLVAAAASAASASPLSPAVAALVEGGYTTMTVTSAAKIALAAVLLLAAGAAALVGGRREPSPAVAEKKAADKKPAPADEAWPEGTTVEGRVVDHAGKPVADAEVLLLGAEQVVVEGDGTWFVRRGEKATPKPASVRTDAAGDFRITRKAGAADRVVVIAKDPIFWSVARKDLAAAGRVEVKLPPSGSLAVRCALPGKAAKQPVSVEMRGTGRGGDTLFFRARSHPVANPGEKVFGRLPPGDFAVQRAIETPTRAKTVVLTEADRQVAKVESGKRAVVVIERKVGRPLTGRVKGMEKAELLYAHVTISYVGPEEKTADGKAVRAYTAFDVLPVKADGRFTTDPMPAGKYSFHLFGVLASTPAGEDEQADFEGQADVVVPERGELPVVEIAAGANKRPRGPNRSVRAAVVDDAGKPVPAFQAMYETGGEGGESWTDGRAGVVGFASSWERRVPAVVDVVVRADGFAPARVRFEGRDREKLQNGEAKVVLRRGERVEVRFRLPGGLEWPKGVTPEAYFADGEDRVRPMRQPTNRRRGAADVNMLGLRPLGATRFECRVAADTPAFRVAIHSPGFLQHFEAGPFTLADVKDGVLDVAVPKPATIDVRFDPGAKADGLPFSGVSLSVMRHLQANSYLAVASSEAGATTHALKLADLAPGTYHVRVDTRSKDGGKKRSPLVIDPGAYHDGKRVTLTAGSTARVGFEYSPYDANAFRGTSSAVVRVELPDGSPAKGRRASVVWYDGHYGMLPVFDGVVPAAGDIRLEGLTDRVVSPDFTRPYSVRVDDAHVGQFALGGKRGFAFRLAPRAGDLAPDVELTNLASGKSVSLKSLRGKVVLVEFFATWCGPCQTPMAKLNALAAEKAAAWKDKVAVVPVGIDGVAGRVRDHARRNGWGGLDLHVSGDKAAHDFDAPAARAFGVTGVPEAILIGPDGRILWRGHPTAKDGEPSLEARAEGALTQ